MAASRIPAAARINKLVSVVFFITPPFVRIGKISPGNQLISESSCPSQKKSQGRVDDRDRQKDCVQRDSGCCEPDRGRPQAVQGKHEAGDRNGSAVGLMVSSLAKTENAAVVTLPLLVMPQLLLSRVSFGDANNVLEKSPFGFICHFQASNIYDGMLYLTSLPFITRPTGMVSHLLFVGDNWSSILIEWIYMVLLFVFHLYLAVRVFLCANRNRNDLKDWR